MTITTTLNIGLETNLGGSLVAADVVEYIVARMSQFQHRDTIVSVAWRIQEAEYEHEGETRTERTLVLRIEQAANISDPVFPSSAELTLWCERLHQDCIAAHWRYDGGEIVGTRAALVGPKAHEWGSFNEEFFHHF